MTGTTLSTHDMDPRRKRILIRAWHRGMREMDLLLGAYADARLREMSEEELDQFEILLQAPDQLLFKWVSGREPIPQQYDSPLAQDFIRRSAGGQLSLAR